MFNNQDFMELNGVGSFAVKDQDLAEIARNDQDRLKWSFDHDDDHHRGQIVPEIHEEERSKKDLLVLVPDEQSETGDHQHHTNDFSDGSDNRFYLRNKDRKQKRRRIQISSDEESSDGFTREVPSVTKNGFKRRRRSDEMMSNKMRTLQKIVPNCHKMDKVSVLDKTIEYMKHLQLQLKVMSTMGMNPYIPPAFGMHNHLLTAMAMAHGQNPANQRMSSPLIPALNWPLPPFTNLSFPHSTSSLQCLYGLVPCFPSFLDFIGRL